MSVSARTGWGSGSKTPSRPLCCPGLVYRSSRCAWLMAKLDLLNSGKNPDYWFLCLAVSRHWIALYRLDCPILGCFPTQTSSLTLTPLIPLLTECQDFEKMQAQHQREREHFTNCGLWHLQNQTFCRNSILPRSCPASDIYWKRSQGHLSFPVHCYSQWPSILPHEHLLRGGAALLS